MLGEVSSMAVTNMAIEQHIDHPRIRAWEQRAQRFGIGFAAVGGVALLAFTAQVMLIDMGKDSRRDRRWQVVVGGFVPGPALAGLALGFGLRGLGVLGGELALYPAMRIATSGGVDRLAALIDPSAQPLDDLLYSGMEVRSAYLAAATSFAVGGAVGWAAGAMRGPAAEP